MTHPTFPCHPCDNAETPHVILGSVARPNHRRARCEVCGHERFVYWPSSRDRLDQAQDTYNAALEAYADETRKEWKCRNSDQ